MSLVANLALSAAGGTGTFVAGYFTYLRTKKTRDREVVIESGKLELDERRIVAESYTQARKISQDLVAELYVELDRLRAELRAEKEGRAEDNRRHAAEILELRAMVKQLRSELDVTRAQLRIPGITTTEPEGGGS